MIICDWQSGQNCKYFEKISYCITNDSALLTSLQMTHGELSFCVCGCVCQEHLWLTVLGLKEQREVGKAGRETTSENKGNNCFCANPESHA